MEAEINLEDAINKLLKSLVQYLKWIIFLCVFWSLNNLSPPIHPAYPEAGGRMPGGCLPLWAAWGDGKGQFHKQAADHRGSGSSNSCSRKLGRMVLQRKK